MTRFRGNKEAFGAPGIKSFWTDGCKDGVGTTLSNSAPVWFTLLNGRLTEIYYPTIDRPQIRECQFLITDGRSFLHEESKHLKSKIERYDDRPLGYVITNSEPNGLYSIKKEIIPTPDIACILQRVSIESDPETLKKLSFYLYCTPHMEGGGGNNNGYVIEAGGRILLAAEKNGTWLAIGSSIPFSKLSCGCEGVSDGLTDLSANFKMDWEFDRALNSNIGLIGEFEIQENSTFTVGMAFGLGLHSALTALFQALGIPFVEHRSKFISRWQTIKEAAHPLEKVAQDGGKLFQASHSLLHAHEDKLHPGALIASLSIPWGNARTNDELGGYHLVWTRDMVNTSMGLLALGNTTAPLRAMIYLAASQNEDGGFYQNFWVNGEAYWRGVQLDEVAFPILLAFRLLEEGGLGDFDPYLMVMRAARYLMIHGPSTGQERWEEARGYSPSTLAATITALVCAACFARARGDLETSNYLEEYADFLNRHVEEWTVTTEGVLHPNIKRHYIRIHPIDPHEVQPNEDPNKGILVLANGPIGSDNSFPAKDIIDAGFLELVRYGIRSPEDPLIIDSLQVVDAVLKRETPMGSCWRRYNHDGYGQKADGSPFHISGIGRCWPLLSGERGHYELAAQRDPLIYIKSMEQFASPTGMLPEQIWDEPDMPSANMFIGKPTGSAMPLMWAHAEYVKLLRSVYDGGVFDLVPAVAARYLFGGSQRTKVIEFWKFNRQIRSINRGAILRIQTPDPFRLHWTQNEWMTKSETESKRNSLNIHYVDIPIEMNQKAPIRFTFYWFFVDQWEGRDFVVHINA